MENEFGEALNSTVAGTYQKAFVKENDETITLEIWDTAGDEHYSSAITYFFKDAQAAVIVYDITSQETFEHLDSWKDKIHQNANENIPIIIVGNKTDLDPKRFVSTKQGSSYASRINAHHFIETSAKTGENITELFKSIASVKLISDISKKRITPLDPDEHTQKEKCC